MCFDTKRPVCLALMLAMPVLQPTRAQETAHSAVHTSTEKAKQADAAFRAGYAAMSSHQLQQARDDFQAVVKLVPAIEEGHSALGAVLVQMNAYPEAIPELKQALKLKPGDTSAQTNLAVAYASTGRDAEAIPLFAKLDRSAAAANQPLPLDVLLLYARSLAATGEITAATERLKRAVAQTPADASLHASLHDALGSLYAQQQEWTLAADEFAAALRLDPQLAAAHLHLGVVLLNQQQTDAALRELTTASQLAPQSAMTQLTLGKALAQAGSMEDAQSVLKTAVALDPSNQDAKYQLALTYQANGRFKEALPLFQEVARTDTNNAPLLTNLALNMVQLGNAKDAIPIFQRALTLTPDVETVHEDLGVAYLQASDVDDALREFRAGLKLSPSDPQLHYNLGLALKLKDDLSGAIPELETAAKLDPGAPDPPFTLGILYMQQGRFDEAAQQLNTALKLRPENSDGWAVLGSVYRQQNKLPEAAAALQEAIRLAPQMPGPHITLAGVFAQQGKQPEAAAERKTAADLTRVAVNHQRATFATNTGNMLLEKGQIVDAIARYHEALADDPNFAEAHRQLAIALAREGQTSEAETERKKAVDIEPPQP
jgi:protein O-GlcNAc transferase